MDTIRLISIINQPTVAQPHGVTNSGGGQSPGIIVNLPPGSILSGYIINRDPQGNPILRTDKGDVTFSTNFFLKIGSEVVMRIENIAGSQLAHILTVDGEPPEVAESKSSFAKEPEVIVTRGDITSRQASFSSTQATPAAAPASYGTRAAAPTLTLTGTLISPEVPLPGQPAIPTGSQIVLRLVTVTATAPAPPPAVSPPASTIPVANTAEAPQPLLLSPANPSYATYARAAGQSPVAVRTAPPAETVQSPPLAAATFRPAPPAVTTATQVATVAPGSAATPPPAAPAALIPSSPVSPPQSAATAIPSAVAPAPVVSVLSPVIDAPVTQPAAAASPQTFSANVVSREPTGEILAQTPFGMVRLPAVSALPPGTQVVFELVQTASPKESPTALPQAPLPELARHWMTLEQLLPLLGSRPFGPDGIQNPLPWLIGKGMTAGQEKLQPQAMSAGLMVFIAALKGGDFRNWLGKNNVEWLEAQGHGQLVKKAEGEFLTMARQFVETPPGHWQTLFIPLAAGGEMHQVRLFTKRDRKQKDGQPSKGDEDTRFVVEVDLTQMGEMQMDGFVRRHEKDIEFDLIIRSLTPLPDEIQDDILRIYNETGALTGYRGSLQFQAVSAFPVNPMQEIADHARNVIV